MSRFCHSEDDSRKLLKFDAPRTVRVGVVAQMFLTKTRKEGIKLCWQVMLNGVADPSRLFHTNLWVKFSHMFPNIAVRMSRGNLHIPRRLGDELRRREALMMAEVTSKMTPPLYHHL